MPGLNGTGPQGMGAMTGRGIGNCNPNNANSVSGIGYGMGRGRGIGRGRGYGRGRGFAIGSNFSLQDEKEMLEARIEEIDKYLENEKNKG